MQLTLYCRNGRTELVVAGPAVSGRGEDYAISYRVNGDEPVQACGRRRRRLEPAPRSRATSCACCSRSRRRATSLFVLSPERVRPGRGISRSAD